MRAKAGGGRCSSRGTRGTPRGPATTLSRRRRRKRRSASGGQSEIHTITRKPMSWHDNTEEMADEKFLNLFHHAALEPTKKYSEPQTESQEIGWNTTPLIHVDRNDRRFYLPRRKTEITK
uniref:Family with sequence similarity 183 member A n=1 Tax=Calidris pygmaea TaxID=425635 RepID=A0A8C3JZG3_9CHAR